MKLLFINQYYWPDMAATSQMMTDLCPRLVRSGHEVHILCSRGQYAPPGSPGISGNSLGKPAVTTTPKYELKDGVHIHRVRATGFGKKKHARQSPRLPKLSPNRWHPHPAHRL
ncbi:MAG: hypothetical protein JKX85_14510 [Phycisphaeraceae bacterium]|nr:hypothetical protein [Phycisphaeraceae bacterium]